MQDIGGKNTLLRIDSVYAFISVDNEGNEGVCAFFNEASQSWMPMVAADERRVAQLIPIAEDMSKATNSKQIRLVRFKERQEIRAF